MDKAFVNIALVVHYIICLHEYKLELRVHTSFRSEVNKRSIYYQMIVAEICDFQLYSKLCHGLSSAQTHS